MSSSQNHKAFLDMLAWSEGTDHPNQSTACNGYDVLVGGELVQDLRKHPGKKVWLPAYKIYSTAAGRYQFLRKTWEVLRVRLSLPDFGPDSQDKAALELLRECGALKLLDAGDFAGAVHTARKIWASLPGAGYGQKEHKLEKLRQRYVAAGGTTN